MEKQRTNREWVEALSGKDGIESQNEAIIDLQTRLYRRLYHHYSSRAYQYGLSDRDNQYFEALAQDYSQEGTIKILNELERYDLARESSFLGFAFIVSKNLGGMALRKRRKEMRLVEQDDQDDNLPAGPVTILSVDDQNDEQIAVSQLMQIVTTCGENLTELQHRSFFEFSQLPFDYEGKTRAQHAAATLEISEESYYYHVNRAKKKLRTCLGHAGIDQQFVNQLFQ